MAFAASLLAEIESACEDRPSKAGYPEPTVTGLKQGTRVRHPKYGEGTVFRREEGMGMTPRLRTVQFQQHGVKKLVEEFAQLERLRFR